jgi:glycosyltransferase involved in cell wall biosynthesis
MDRITLEAAHSSISMNAEVSLLLNAETLPAFRPRVVFLTNFLPPYRLPVLRALRPHVSALKTFVSTKMEENRSWVTDWKGLEVDIQKSLSTKKCDRHPDGFTQETYLHLPYDTLPKLAKFRPDVVISGEMGARTIQAVLYRIAVSSTRLIIHADLSEHTELGRGGWRVVLRKWMVKHADAILVNGNSGARYIESLGVPDVKIFRVPYATDTSIYTAEKRNQKPTEITRLLHVGQLIERKGILPFLLKLAAWASEHLERKLELMLIGNGPLRAQIEAVKIPINLQITVINSKAYAEMPAVYSQADIFILPTLADSWGLVVNEAMAAGLPVLGSCRSQAVEELVKDGETGWLFNPDDPRDVDSALDRALSANQMSRNQMGAKARESAMALTATVVAERMAHAIDYCYRK